MRSRARTKPMPGKCRPSGLASGSVWASSEEAAPGEVRAERRGRRLGVGLEGGGGGEDDDEGEGREQAGEELVVQVQLDPVNGQSPPGRAGARLGCGPGESAPRRCRAAGND